MSQEMKSLRDFQVKLVTPRYFLRVIRERICFVLAFEAVVRRVEEDNSNHDTDTIKEIWRGRSPPTPACKHSVKVTFPSLVTCIELCSLGTYNHSEAFS